MEQNKNNGTTSAAKWKEVLIGGVSGIALGTAGTLFARGFRRNSRNTRVRGC